MSPAPQCMICRGPLFDEESLVFPTGSAYHWRCLEQTVEPTLGGPLQAKLAAHRQALARAQAAGDVAAQRLEEARILRIVADEDCFCGEFLVESVGQAFPAPVAGDDWDLWD